MLASSHAKCHCCKLCIRRVATCQGSPLHCTCTNQQGSGLIRHVFRLLERAIADQHPVPWVLLENVEALLDRVQGGSPPIK